MFIIFIDRMRLAYMVQNKVDEVFHKNNFFT